MPRKNRLFDTYLFSSFVEKKINLFGHSLIVNKIFNFPAIRHVYSIFSIVVCTLFRTYR